MTSYRHGFTLATTSNHKRKPGKRGKLSGWSPGAARRNVKFLQAVDERELDGLGLALTLTLRDCPPDAASWAAMLKAWIKRQQRAGMIRLHWVMEFQRRGVPHLHVAIWYDPDHVQQVSDQTWRRVERAMIHQDMRTAGLEHQRPARKAVADWLDITEALGSAPQSQQARPIVGPVGWFQYLAKHCGRGREHYQRQQESLPEAWESSPKVWGHWGTWTLQEPATATLTNQQFYRLRRLVRAWSVARARAQVPGPGWTWQPEMFTRDQLRDMPIVPGKLLGDFGKPLRPRLRSLQHARAMLDSSDREHSEVCGVREWAEEADQSELLRAVEPPANRTRRLP